MAEDAKKELGALRAEYKQIVGKNPSPRLDVEGLAAKIAELKANPPELAEAAPAKEPAAPKAKRAAKPAADASAEPTPSPLGTAFVQHPEGIGCSYGGVELAPDKSGKLLVPLQAVEELKAHGFEIV